MSIPCDRLAALGEDALFMAVLEDTHRLEDAYAARAFRPPSMQCGLEAEPSPHFDEAQ
ncbi:MAG TPA: hypothetical protein VEU33_21205 [Archangium sp.]|nr:hypothetical protein [Archangium sp.]